MKKIALILTRIERVKTFVEGWERTGNISGIERKVVLNQLAALYDELLDLTPVANPAPAEEVELPMEEPVVSVQPVVEVPVTKPKPAVDVQPQVVVSEQPVVVATPAQQPVAAPAAKQGSASNTYVADDAVVNRPTQSGVRLGDTFSSTRKFLFESLGGSNDFNSAKLPPITDINRAIGINDRFLFIKELFDGNHELFNETVSRLNGCSNIEEAFMHIHEHFSWDSENPAVKQLVLLLHRRFIRS